MPELPEVETVRRGLQGAMEGAKIVKAELRRKDLRFPFQKDFSARLQGKTVTGLGRRAKYLLADLSSGDVLLMHLGMSGSFRVLSEGSESKPGKFHHPRSEQRAHDRHVPDQVRVRATRGGGRSTCTGAASPGPPRVRATRRWSTWRSPCTTSW